MSTPAPLGGALRAAARGWHVFPVGGRYGPKAPPPGWRWTTLNTADPKLIGQWLTGAGAYGIACGPSGLVVIDLDVAIPASEGGEAAFTALVNSAGAKWPSTFTVRTPSGGWHLYFQADPQVKITVSTGTVAPHVDVRGVGGYVVGPGSVIDGRPYEVVNRGEVVPLPGWLARLCVPRPVPVTVPGTVPRSPDRYAQAALDAEAALVAAAPEGCRNDQLSRSAFALARFPERDLPAAAILPRLSGAAYQAGLREPEVGRTIRSALRARRTGGAA